MWERDPNVENKRVNPDPSESRCRDELLKLLKTRKSGQSISRALEFRRISEGVRDLLCDRLNDSFVIFGEGAQFRGVK